MPTTRRKYGNAHQIRRKSIAPLVLSGNVACTRCGEPIRPGERWHLGHSDADPRQYAGPEHERCNVRAARVRQEQLRAPEPPPEPAGLPADDPRFAAAWLADLRNVPRNATWPRLMTIPHPRAVNSLGPDFERFAHKRSGKPLRWWQKLVARRLLEVDATGELVWQTLVLSLARQLGKSWLLRELILWRIHQGERFGERQTVMHTGKDLAICKDVQLEGRLWAKRKPDLFKVREVNGQEEIELREDGSRWMLRAKESVYGYSVSAAAVDEAWKVRASSIEEGLTPTLIEREQSQLWLVSTAHRMATVLMLERRALALAELETGEGDLLIEWSAPRELALDDVAGWRQASPHWSPRRERDIGRRLLAAQRGELVRDEDEPDPLESFKCQWLNQWPRRQLPLLKVEPLLPEGLWRSLEDELEPNLEPLFVGLEDNFGEGAAVAAACWLPDGRLEVDGWTRLDWDSAIFDLHRLAALRRIRELHAGASLVDRLLPPNGLPKPKPAVSSQTAHGLALLRDLAAGGVLVHDGAEELGEAIGATQVREGVSGLQIASQGPKHLVKAACWALLAAHKPAKLPAIR